MNISIQKTITRMMSMFWGLGLTYNRKGVTSEIMRALLWFVTGTQAINLFLKYFLISTVL